MYAVPARFTDNVLLHWRYACFTLYYTCCYASHTLYHTRCAAYCAGFVLVLLRWLCLRYSSAVPVELVEVVVVVSTTTISITMSNLVVVAVW